MAKDIFHQQAKNALIKDGWIITDDPLTIRISEAVKVQIDLAASSAIAAERETEKIAVEIKSFISSSPVTDLENALGQFILYYDILEEQGSDRILYLAIPHRTYTEIFTEPIGKILLKRNRLRLLVFDPKQEVIVQWIP